MQENGFIKRSRRYVYWIGLPIAVICIGSSFLLPETPTFVNRMSQALLNLGTEIAGLLIAFALVESYFNTRFALSRTIDEKVAELETSQPQAIKSASRLNSLSTKFAQLDESSDRGQIEEAIGEFTEHAETVRSFYQSVNAFLDIFKERHRALKAVLKNRPEMNEYKGYLELVINYLKVYENLVEKTRFYDLSLSDSTAGFDPVILHLNVIKRLYKEYTTQAHDRA